MATNQSFGQLAAAIDDAFARWDRSHLHEFELDDGTRVGMPDPDSDFDDDLVDERNLKLSRLKPGERFTYVFDFGWGVIPDQYGRAWSDDDGEAERPDPELIDLPPLRPGWGRRRRANS